MICNHVLSGESIKQAGASAPLLRGLLLFPHPATHLIQALLSAFRPPLNTLAHGQPLHPAVGLVKGVEEVGGIDRSAVDFSWLPLYNGKGLRGTSRRERGHRRRRRKERGCLISGSALTKTGAPCPSH